MRTCVGALLAAILVTGCSADPFDDDGREATSGEVFAAVGQVEGIPVTLTLPGGRYDFVVSKPHDSTTHTTALDAEGVSPEAADGRAFLDVAVSRSRMDGDVWMLQPEGNEPIRFWIEYDGKQAVLDQEASSSWVVAVPEDAEIRLVAEFDGREISVDPYDQVPAPGDRDVYGGTQPRLIDVPCRREGQVKAGGATFNGTECSVRVLEPVPWFQAAPGATGWAPEGRAWVLVRATIEINTFFSQEIAGEYVSRETTYGEPAYRLDGRPPAAMFDGEFREIQSRPDDMRVYDARWLLFEVPEDARSARLGLRLTYAGVPEDSEVGADTVQHTVRRSMDLQYR